MTRRIWLIIGCSVLGSMACGRFLPQQLSSEDRDDAGVDTSPSAAAAALDAATTPNVDASSSSDATTSVVGCAATFCERFDDDALAQRGWIVRDAKVESGELHAESSTEREHIARVLTLNTTAHRLAITITMKVVNRGDGQVDLIALSVPAASPGFFSGVSLAFRDGSFALVAYENGEDLNEPPEKPTTSAMTFVQPTQAKLVIDYATKLASLEAQGVSSSVSLPPTMAQAMPRQMDLLVGFSFSRNELTAWDVRYDNVVVE